MTCTLRRCIKWIILALGGPKRTDRSDRKLSEFKKKQDLFKTKVQRFPRNNLREWAANSKPFLRKGNEAGLLGWSKTCQHFTVGDKIHPDWSQTRVKALGELLEHQVALLNLSPQSSDLSFFQGDTVCRLRWVRYSKYHKKLTVTFLALKNGGTLCVPFSDGCKTGTDATCLGKSWELEVPDPFFKRQKQEFKKQQKTRFY